jgi:predicted ArsR family transcriptional regulator
MSVRRKGTQRSKGGADAAPETYSVMRLDQLEALISTRRHDIVDQVAARGPMSVKEIAAAVGAQPSALYYHIEQLCAVGLLREAGARQSGPRTEQLYETPAPRMRLYEALQDARRREVMCRIVGALCRQADRDFARGFAAGHSKTAGVRRNTRWFRLVGRPDEATLELINAHLDAVTELMAASANGPGERIALTWVAAAQQDELVEDD